MIYHPKLLELAAHYGFAPRACAAYRAKTKGKVERPFRYIREDFFLARSFCNLDDLNAQFEDWLATVANARCHGTTRRVVQEAYAEECERLGSLPGLPFNAVLSLQRRVSHDGMVSVNGNRYSVPDRTRRGWWRCRRWRTKCAFTRARGCWRRIRCWKAAGKAGWRPATGAGRHRARGASEPTV